MSDRWKLEMTTTYVATSSTNQNSPYRWRVTSILVDRSGKADPSALVLEPVWSNDDLTARTKARSDARALAKHIETQENNATTIMTEFF